MHNDPKTPAYSNTDETVRIPKPIAPNDPDDEEKGWEAAPPKIGEFQYASGYEKAGDSMPRPGIFVQFMKWMMGLRAGPRMIISVIMMVAIGSMITILAMRFSRDDPAIVVTRQTVSAPETKMAVYTVKTGENWESIAEKNGIEWQDLVRANIDLVRANTEWCKKRPGVGEKYLEKGVLLDGTTPRKSVFCQIGAEFEGEKLAIGTLKADQKISIPSASNKNVATKK